MEKHKWNFADTITASRIIVSVSLIFLSLEEIVFYILYAIAGGMDALDGFVARKTDSVSSFGARFDSLADLIFCAIIFSRILPLLFYSLPAKLWIIVGIIVFIRLVSYIFAGIKYRRFAALHTIMNKLTGFALFLLPFFIRYSVTAVYFFVMCGLALVAAVEELLIHICRTEYNPNVKSLFFARERR